MKTLPICDATRPDRAQIKPTVSPEPDTDVRLNTVDSTRPVSAPPASLYGQILCPANVHLDLEVLLQIREAHLGRSRVPSTRASCHLPAVRGHPRSPASGTSSAAVAMAVPTACRRCCEASVTASRSRQGSQSLGCSAPARTRPAPGCAASGQTR